MKNLCITVVTTLAITSSLFAEPWTAAVDANLTLTQNAYSDNWVGGESGSLSYASNANFLAEKQLSTKVHNKNGLRLAFGQTYNQDKETKEWSDPVKSTDLIDFETVFRFTLGAFVDPFAAGRFESQFYDDSDPGLDRFFNPVDFTESLGIARVLIKEEKREWAVRLGAGLRQHLNRDMLDTLTNQRETEKTNDGGIEFVTDFTTPLARERMTFTSKFTLFKALFFSESDKLTGQPNEDYWQYPDINWENTFTANIISYVMVNLYVQLLYDKEIDPGARFKQTLSLGLTFKII